MSERTSRDLEQREAVKRPTKWVPPQLLPVLRPEPGYQMFWVRTSIQGVADPMNISSKFREGWEPVKASDHPEVRQMMGENTRIPDSIEYGGLLACKTPEEFVAQRSEYYRKVALTQMESVDNSFMRDNNPLMPLFKERSSSVSFGKGT